MRLILLRHAKSDWDADYGRDHERPLAPRGIRAARAVGVFLAKAGQVPDAAVTSYALRARTTLELAMEAGGWTCPVRVSHGLYGASPASVMEEISQESAERLLIVGHEPTWSTLAGLLVGASIRMPTAALAAIDVAGLKWGNVQPGAGELAWLVPARLLTDGDLDLVQ